ncbi:multicopper oxidase family protein [Actinomadura chokoriensis]|uniref:multicopper oxidase family protein n=1 Tax=Actinomadura chokoriensis TaxID=454156 RepID=UPI0031F7B937
MLSRRGVIRLGAVAAGAAALPGTAAIGRRGRAWADVTAPPPFSVPLSVPETAVPVRRTATTDYYDMTIRDGAAEILPGVSTPIMGYEGRFPGPTIRAEAGRRVVVRQTNAMTHETVVHLHGGLVAPGQDGHPADAIAPGADRRYVYGNRQPAATLWYHDHSHHMEAEMVFRGLAGFYLLGDRRERRLGLPSGRYDVPLMLRDARFDEQGRLLFEMDDFRYRNTLLVNGRPQPYLRVAGRKYRLRLLNGSNERYFTLRLGEGDGDAMTVIASDGGLLPAPVTAASVTLSPAERVDVVVDFARYRPGTRVVLHNTDGTDDATTSVMRFDVGHRVPDFSRVPERLGRAHDLGEAVATRDIAMNLDLSTGRFVIDGRTFDMDRVDMRIKRGETEIWRVHNRDVQPSVPHNFHVHGTHFQVLDRNGRPVTGHEAGRKDTVAVPIGGDVRLKVRFDRYLGRYLYHCHLLDHSSMGMMAQAEVIA